MSDLSDLFRLERERAALEKERDALLKINASLLKDMQTLATINLTEDNCASLEVANRRIRAFARESIKKVGEQ